MSISLIKSSNLDLSIVIPSYAEADNLKLLIPQLKSVVKNMGVNAELVIVDTMNPIDDTPTVCRRYKVRYIKRKGNNTYGAGIITGISATKGKYVVIMDADGSHSPDFIENMWSIKDGYDLIIASRYIKGGHTDNNLLQVLLSKLVNLVYSRILKIPIADVSNSFRLYHGEIIRSLNLSSKHFDIQEEILVKMLWEQRQKVKELPYRFKRRMHGKSKRILLFFVFHYFRSLYRFYILKRNLSTYLEQI